MPTKKPTITSRHHLFPSLPRSRLFHTQYLSSAGVISSMNSGGSQLVSKDRQIHRINATSSSRAIHGNKKRRHRHPSFGRDLPAHMFITNSPNVRLHQHYGT
ncbi:hypothetical protein NXS19_004984 [Fusarium pseudograminearum]|nr:hypothetical protein NXS19_004984 [Fusarium pseudograminearum]